MVFNPFHGKPGHHVAHLFITIETRFPDGLILAWRHVDRDPLCRLLLGLLGLLCPARRCVTFSELLRLGAFGCLGSGAGLLVDYVTE